MEGGKGVVGIRDLFRWVGDGRESSSGQKGGGTKDLAVLELLFPGPWVTGGGRDERPRRSPFELRYRSETVGDTDTPEWAAKSQDSRIPTNEPRPEYAILKSSNIVVTGELS